MDQQPPKGNFRAYINPSYTKENRQPQFNKGEISKPGSTVRFSVELWPFTYIHKTSGKARTGYNGRMGLAPLDATPRDQLEAETRGRPVEPSIEVAGNTLQPLGIILYASDPKEGSTSDNPKDFYGYANFGDGDQPVDLAVWIEQTRYQKLYLSGSTEYPRAKEASPNEVEALIEDGKVSKGMPKGRKPRGDDEGRAG